jgi:hypothetical protein
MSKNLKIFIIVFALAGCIALLGAIANVEGFDLIKTISYWTSCALGLGVIIKVLLWDWKEAKKDSKDRSFRLRK